MCRDLDVIYCYASALKGIMNSEASEMKCSVRRPEEAGHWLRRNIRKMALLRACLILVLVAVLVGCTREEVLFDHLEENRLALQVPASEDDSPIAFVIGPGTPARAISENLATAGLILDPELFEAYVRSIGRAQELKAGSFLLRASMTPVEIAEVLLSEQAPGIRVTIREGWRLEQVADALQAEGVVSGPAYRRIAELTSVNELDSELKESAAVSQGDAQNCCQNADERWPFLTVRPDGATLEGFLFPATYQLPLLSPTADKLIVRQLDSFADRILTLYMQAESDGVNPPSLYEALIMASIVEREAAAAEDRPVIAGVIFNRLAAGMLLEIDATVQYAMGFQPASGQWWKTPVFLEEYQGVHSPFNTYLHRGLPPGPIASPGEDSFRAVLYPDRHAYYYYVASGDGSGGHVFAETYAEHLENVRRYLNR